RPPRRRGGPPPKPHPPRRPGRAPQRPARPLGAPQPQRYRPTPGRPARRVSETDEPLAARGLEQLDDGGETLVARSLRQRQLVDQDRGAPWRRRLARSVCVHAATVERKV